MPSFHPVIDGSHSLSVLLPTPPASECAVSGRVFARTRYGYARLLFWRSCGMHDRLSLETLARAWMMGLENSGSSAETIISIRLGDFSMWFSTSQLYLDTYV